MRAFRCMGEIERATVVPLEMEKSKYRRGKKLK